MGYGSPESFIKPRLCSLQPFPWVFLETIRDVSSAYGWVSSLLISSERRASGKPQEAIGEDKGPEAALRSTKNGRAGEILKASVTLQRLPSNTSYQVSTDMWRAPRVICLSVHTQTKVCISPCRCLPLRSHHHNHNKILTAQGRTKAEQALHLSTMTNTGYR